MKVLLVNGSPHEKGCTFTALSIVQNSLLEEKIESDILWVGKTTKSGCTACNACTKNGKCVFDDPVNEVVENIDSYDGFVFGSPVYFASPSGALISFMDRLFRIVSPRGKPAAAIVSARRAGTTASLDAIQKYFSFSSMPIVSSNYWTMVHGNTPEEVLKDEEGIQIMRILGKNMAWLLQCIEKGKESNINFPKTEEKIKTNFIR